MRPATTKNEDIENLSAVSAKKFPSRKRKIHMDYPLFGKI